MAMNRTKYPGIYWRDTNSGRRWDTYVHVGGAQRYANKTFKSEGEAKKWKRDMETRKGQGEQPTTDKRTFAQYLTAWLELKAAGAVIDRKMQKNKIGPRTLADYQRLAKDWIIEPAKARQLPPVGRVRLDRLTYHTLEQLYGAMKPHTTVGTVKKLNRLLGQAFAELVKKSVLARNPADWASVPQVDVSASAKRGDDDADDVNDSVAQAMTEEEAERFLASARAIAEEQERKTDMVPLIPERCWSAWWHMLAGCGLRPGEAFALRWKDVDEIGQQILVRRNLIRVRGKAGYELGKPKTKRSERKVPVPAPVWDELKKWRKVQKLQRMHAGEVWQDLGFVFTTSKGTPLHGARRSFERVCARAALGQWGEETKREHVTGPLKARQFDPAFRIYDLRHTYVTLLLMAGTPVNVVADLVGHETASFTIARYGHALPKQTKAAVATLEAVLFRKMG